MGTELTYPKLPDGKPWNLKNKIRIKIGYSPTIYGTSQNTIMRFAEDLQQSEIDEVDALMSDPNTAQDPNAPWITGNSCRIKDIYKHKGTFETNAGYTCEIFYDDVLGEIVLQFNQLLNNPAKNDVEAAFADLFTWDV